MVEGPRRTAAPLDAVLPRQIRKSILTQVGAGEAAIGLLGDATRRAIFEHLARRPSSVGELADRLPITRQAVSQHLQVLKDGGLVVSTAAGTRRIYRLNAEGVDALRSYLQRIWDDALTSFQKAADQAGATAEEEDP